MSLYVVFTHQESEALNTVKLGEMIDIKQVSDVSTCTMYDVCSW